MKRSKIVIAALALVFSSTMVTSSIAQRYTIQVDNANKGVIKALTKKLGGDIHVDASGFIAASFTDQDLTQVRGLLKNPHIKLIEVDQKRYFSSMFTDDVGNAMAQQLTPYAVYQSQANQLSFQAQTDPAMKVCVIDSGIDHGDYGPNGNINPDFNWSTITGADDPNAGGTTGNWYQNGGPHGTHVAGTIGAMDNNIGVVGMAPSVPMHIVKVFNAQGWGYSSDLAVAQNECSLAGANIISMSLGGDFTNSVEEAAFESFTANGGLVIAAAGNNGSKSRSYPAGYPAVMMIGANDADNNIADFSQYPHCGKGRRRNENTCVEVTAGGVNTLSTYPANTARLATMSADGVSFASAAMENSGAASGSMVYVGYGSQAEVTSAGVQTNDICVIDRGSYSFHDKVLNCQNAGGIGAIIINNEPGMLYGTLGSPNATTIPAVGAAFEDRSTLVALTAEPEDITANVAIGASDYGYMSGTSMATPAVSGIAALVWSHHSSCTGADIRNALKVTATGAGNRISDKFGYGIVQAVAANDYLVTHGCAGNEANPPEEEEPEEEPPVCRGGWKKCPNN